jgi:hypothetical protein
MPTTDDHIITYPKPASFTVLKFVTDSLKLQYS